ncbi:elongation of very long chain fatty acids protein AAEL008004-like [Neocloeon triangulifer]|uniref:elongation of very long chain fatty acids protein AAEL008004-like n=1 Tax=Neocloeon triangulifer TaxID=2078957 RepID=UPI00286EED9A|nr:elongation of very long chain fatty acids protein AAEL008004-like [Neocloeon triangulifer]
MLETISSLYENAISSADKRVSDWALMSGPGLLLSILAVYYLLVRVIGPSFMEKRQAMQLKGVITMYNSIQVLACALLVQQTVKYIKNTNVTIIGCASVDFSDNPNAVQLARMCWWYLILKLLDLVETLFFILRKKHNQVSNLHLYHHISTPIFSWIMVKFVAGGTPSIYIALNSAIHVLMYLYYLFTGIGMSKKLAPWKKYLTIIQMVQFCALIIHASQFVLSDCHMPTPLAIVFIPNVAIVYFMFANFYKKAYGKATNDINSFKPNLKIMVDNRNKKPAIKNL